MDDERITNFEDAKEQAVLAAGQQQQNVDQPIDQPAEQQQQQAVAPEEEALRMAEAAAAAAQQKDEQLRQVMGRMQQLEAQNQQMNALIQQMSQRQEEKIVEEVFEYPTLDISTLMYSDPEEQARKQQEYADKMAALAEQRIMKKLEPKLSQFQNIARQNERNEVIQGLSAMPELPGFREMLPQIEQIVQKNKALASADNLSESYVTAYAIARGVNAMNQPKEEMTVDGLLEMYNSNPDFQKAIERQRLVKNQENQEAPAFSANGSAINAALNIPKKATNFEEAKEQMLKSLGVI